MEDRPDVHILHEPAGALADDEGEGVADAIDHPVAELRSGAAPDMALVLDEGEVAHLDDEPDLALIEVLFLGTVGEEDAAFGLLRPLIDHDHDAGGERLDVIEIRPDRFHDLFARVALMHDLERLLHQHAHRSSDCSSSPDGAALAISSAWPSTHCSPCTKPVSKR